MNVRTNRQGKGKMHIGSPAWQYMVWYKLGKKEAGSTLTPGRALQHEASL